MTEYEPISSHEVSRKPTLRPSSRPPLKPFDTNTHDVSVTTIDTKDKQNPQRVGEYAEEIFTYLRVVEKELSPSADYMTLQPDINFKMRAILVDWIVAMHAKYRLMTETLFLTVNLIDRYLEKRTILRNQLQLVGTSALLIACKYEEIYPPETRDFIGITEKAYTKQQLVRMEADILNAISYRICIPTSWRFLERFSHLVHQDEVSFALSRYLLELSLMEYHMLKYRPSELAACAIYLSNKITKREHNILSFISSLTRHDEDIIRNCARDLLILFQTAPKHTLSAIRDKFCSSSLHGVSKFRII